MGICDKGLPVFITRYKMNYYQASAGSLPGALFVNSVPYFDKMKCKLNSSRKSVVESYMNDNLDNKISNTNP